MGSFSSGQVAEPFELESKKYSWPKQREVDDENGNEFVEFVCSWSDFKPSKYSEFPVFRPGQGMATEASEEKHSKDLMDFDCEIADSPCSE